jgi:TonB family protein
MSRTTALALLLFAAASLSAQAPETPPAAANAPAEAQAPESSEHKPIPDSAHVIIKESFPVVYSKSAEDKKLHGKVVLSVLFNEAGTTESSEVSSGDPRLAECVTAAIGKWRIEPFIRDGKPVKVKVPLTFEFIHDDPPISFATGDAVGPEADPGANAIILGDPLEQKLLQKKAPPEYPEPARKAGIAGSVVFFASVGKDGAIRELHFVSGPPLLAKAAEDAVRQWRYQPYLYGGHPVAFDIRIQVNFTLTPL